MFLLWFPRTNNIAFVCSSLFALISERFNYKSVTSSLTFGWLCLRERSTWPGSVSQVGGIGAVSDVEIGRSRLPSGLFLTRRDCHPWIIASNLKPALAAKWKLQQVCIVWIFFLQFAIPPPPPTLSFFLSHSVCLTSFIVLLLLSFSLKTVAASSFIVSSFFSVPAQVKRYLECGKCSKCTSTMKLTRAIDKITGPGRCGGGQNRPTVDRHHVRTGEQRAPRRRPGRRANVSFFVGPLCWIQGGPPQRCCLCCT